MLFVIFFLSTAFLKMISSANKKKLQFRHFASLLNRPSEILIEKDSKNVAKKKMKENKTKISGWKDEFILSGR